MISPAPRGGVLKRYVPIGRPWSDLSLLKLRDSEHNVRDLAHKFEILCLHRMEPAEHGVGLRLKLLIPVYGDSPVAAWRTRSPSVGGSLSGHQRQIYVVGVEVNATWHGGWKFQAEKRHCGCLRALKYGELLRPPTSPLGLGIITLSNRRAP